MTRATTKPTIRPLRGLPGSLQDIHARVQNLSPQPRREEHNRHILNWHFLLSDVILNAPEREYTRVRKALRRAQRAIEKRLGSVRGREERRAA
jgi:hypothetical protein